MHPTNTEAKKIIKPTTSKPKKKPATKSNKMEISRDVTSTTIKLVEYPYPLAKHKYEILRDGKLFETRKIHEISLSIFFVLVGIIIVSVISCFTGQYDDNTECVWIINGVLLVFLVLSLVVACLTRKETEIPAYINLCREIEKRYAESEEKIT